MTHDEWFLRAQTNVYNKPEGLAMFARMTSVNSESPIQDKTQQESNSKTETDSANEGE